jgi:hypothetical protein
MLSSDPCGDMNSYKEAFLKKYNPGRTLEKALSQAIKASVQHNSLYKPNISSISRGLVRREWRKYLEAFVLRYEVRRSVDEYEQDIQLLKNSMNRRFADSFYPDPHPKFKTAPGFRISHAQKSIGVFLKHLWCMGIVATPPQCPVDGIILEAVGQRYPETKWGYVDTIDEHRRKIASLTSAAQSVDLAEWELKTFGL